VDPREPDTTALDEAVAVLRRGGLVAFPTETVYGLGAPALHADAVQRIFDAKARPSTDPVIVHVAHVDALAQVASDIPDHAHDLARRFWPGPLTLILRRQPGMPDVVSAGLPTVGVRVPAHPVAMALLRRAGVPVAAPSANQFSRPSPTTAAHVLADLDGRIDLVLDAGPTPIGVESTVLDLTTTPALVRRPGGISIEALRAVLPDVGMTSVGLGVADAQPAPGQLARHYAPRAPLTLYLGDPHAVCARLAADARSLAASGNRVGVLAPEEDLMTMAPRLAAVASSGRIITRPYGSRARPDEAARALFGAVRDLDAAGVDAILASAPEPRAIGVAIVDRLRRAADGRVVLAGDPRARHRS
jgi:L-threonylcarbamoyladenylate synthase